MRNDERQKYREELRKHALRLDTALGLICCRVCGGSWAPGRPETHAAESCLARTPDPPLPPGAGDDSGVREFMRASGIAWPEPDPEVAGGARFSKALSVDVRIEKTVHWSLPPAPPDRSVPAKVADWDPGEVLEWRELDDAEWAAVMARYDESLKEWKRCGGMFYEMGPTTTTGHFVLETGGTARGYYRDGRWLWTEWSTR
jgi:hypothetical protein